MKQKIGMSKYEKVLTHLYALGNGIIIILVDSKISTIFLSIGFHITLLCLYNAIKSIEAYVCNMENTKNDFITSISCFLIGFIICGVTIVFTVNSFSAYIFLIYYHLIVAFLTTPLLLLLNKLQKQGKTQTDIN